MYKKRDSQADRWILNSLFIWIWLLFLKMSEFLLLSICRVSFLKLLGLVFKKELDHGIGIQPSHYTSLYAIQQQQKKASFNAQ